MRVKPVFRISVDRGGRREVVRFAGHLAGEALPELEATWRSLRGPIFLDLEQLRWADREGVTMIARLARAGAELVNVPPHVRERLKARQRAGWSKAPGGEA
jgi:hypothetical protein